MKCCKTFRLTPVCSFGLQNGLDFTIATHMSKAMEYIDENEPSVLSGSPPCTMMTTHAGAEYRTAWSRPSMEEKVRREARAA